MKLFAYTITLLSVSAGMALGQTNQTDRVEVPKPAPVEEFEHNIPFEIKPSSEVLGQNKSYRGVLPAVKKAANPLQLINPLAPAKYGNGFDNVAIDPVTRRAEGITLFAIRF